MYRISSHPWTRFVPIVLALSLTLPALAQANGLNKVYWSQYSGGDIRRANLDGSSAETVRPGALSYPLTVAYGKIYYASGNDIRRSNLNGSGDEFVLTSLAAPRGFAIDPGAGRLYWSHGSTISRANLDGSGPSNLMTGLAQPLDLALDLGAGKIYYVEINGDRVARANLSDGSNPEALVQSPAVEGPTSIDLDLGAGKIYFNSQRGTNRRVQRANFDGSDVQTLATTPDPQGVAVHPASGSLFWTDQSDQRVYRANLDGTGAVAIASGTGPCAGIDVREDNAVSGASPLAAGGLAVMLLAAGGVLLVRRRLA